MTEPKTAAEKWARLQQFPDYEVSNRGQVRHHDKMMSTWANSDGYRMVTLRAPGIEKKARVHRLVAMAFCDGHRPGLEVNHKNGDKTNNHADNLEWVTTQENVIHSFRLGLRVPNVMLGEKNPGAKLTENDVRDIRRHAAEPYRGMFSELARRFGVSDSTIRAVVTRKCWRHVQEPPK